MCESDRLYYVFVLFFFFKQKTAYEMRISDWSSDVCSSDLGGGNISAAKANRFSSSIKARQVTAAFSCSKDPSQPKNLYRIPPAEIGRASCRERVCQYV